MPLLYGQLQCDRPIREMNFSRRIVCEQPNVLLFFSSNPGFAACKGRLRLLTDAEVDIRFILIIRIKLNVSERNRCTMRRVFGMGRAGLPS